MISTSVLRESTSPSRRFEQTARSLLENHSEKGSDWLFRTSGSPRFNTRTTDFPSFPVDPHCERTALLLRLNFTDVCFKLISSFSLFLFFRFIVNRLIIDKFHRQFEKLAVHSCLRGFKLHLTCFPSVRYIGAENFFYFFS